MNPGRDKILERAVASRSDLCVQGYADVIARLRTSLSGHSSQPVAALGITASLIEQLQPFVPQRLKDPSLHPDP